MRWCGTACIKAAFIHGKGTWEHGENRKHTVWVWESYHCDEGCHFPSDEILKPAQKRCVRRTGKALCGTVPQGGGTGGSCRNEGAGEYSRYTREIFVCSDRAEMSVTAAFGEWTGFWYLSGSGLLPQKGFVGRIKSGYCKNSCGGEKGILCVSICFSEKYLGFLSGIPEKTERLFCGWSGGKESGCSLVCTQVSAADANDPGSGALYLQSQGTGNIAWVLSDPYDGALRIKPWWTEKEG